MTKTKREKALRTRKILDWVMLVFMFLVMGFLAVVFGTTIWNLFAWTWGSGLGFIPLTCLGLALFLSLWAYMDKKTDKTLEDEPRE